VNFLRTHGNGFLLHMLGAVAIMALGWWFGHLIAAAFINTLLWPLRELWQKRHAPKDFFTFHVFLEWVPAVAVGWLAFGFGSALLR